MRLVLDKMSRVVVPKQLRDRFALAPGHELEVVLEADGFRLRPTNSASVLSDQDGLLICNSDVAPGAWDIGDFLDQERKRRNRQLAAI